jgi:hypothetical protein
LAGKWGHPFGFVSCWPFQNHTPAQFENMVSLYKEWWEVHSRTQVAHLLYEAHGVQGIHHAEEAIRARLADLMWQTLEWGLPLRLEPALPPPPAPEPPPPQAPEPPVGPVRQSLFALRERANSTMERVADAVQDAIMDWNTTEPPLPKPVEPLPPLQPLTLVHALRGFIEETVATLAELLNEAGTAADLTENRRLLRQLCEEMLAQVMEQGMRIRIDAAVARLPAVPGPRGAWVERYRRMLAAEGRLPADTQYPVV